MSLARAKLSPEGDIIRPEGSGLGKTSYGELNRERSARCEAIQTALAAGGVASTISDDILAEMWAKFCGFAAAATIAALIRARAGEIASAVRVQPLSTWSSKNARGSRQQRDIRRRRKWGTSFEECSPAPARPMAPRSYGISRTAAGPRASIQSAT